MPDLVTLNSAPYNPYNDTFGRFAMQGLQMGLSLMEHKDSLAQRQSEQLQSQISEGTQNLFKGVELSMRNKELNHRIENDQFNQQLDSQKFQFSKDSFWKNIGMQEEERTYERKHAAEVDDPYKKSLTEANTIASQEKRDTWQYRLEEAKNKVAADKLALDFNTQTQASRIASANLDPAAKALEISAAAARSPYAADLAKTELELKQSQIEENQGRAAYYAGGGASKTAAHASASELRTLISAQSSIEKDLEKIGGESKDAQANLKRAESILNNPNAKMSEDDRKRNEEIRDKSKAIIESGSGKSTMLKANKAEIDRITQEIIKQFDSFQKARGKSAPDISKLSPEERAARALEFEAYMQSQGAASTGQFPGSQAAPSPADQAAQEAQAGKPVGVPSKNPPSSVHPALDMNNVYDPYKGADPPVPTQAPSKEKPNSKYIPER